MVTSWLKNRCASPNHHLYLPVFKGSCEWRVFWLQFQRASKRYCWDAKATLDRLVSCLQDDALDYYAQLPEYLQADLNSTVKAMEQRFGDHKLPETYRASLHSLRKENKETLEEYAARVQRTVVRAYPGIAGTVLMEDMTIEILVGGLPDSGLIYDVLTKKPKTVREAIDWIQWHESCKGAQR